jgi:nitroimidazol reductase NimA-like FMN-containing flavoprotein (pyridoxamine 5'-phosphate oxidase superfamily)
LVADSPDVPDHVVDYIDQEKTLTLATAAPGGPPHATTLVYVNDGPVLYIWLRESAATRGQLDKNPEVGFAIDEYADDWRQTKGVQGTGTAQTVTDGEELAKAGDLFGRKFPELRPGATSVVSFFRITPTELHFIDNTRGEGEPDPDEFRRESFGGTG